MFKLQCMHKFGVRKILNVLKSLMLSKASFIWSKSKNSNIVNYYYSLKKINTFYLNYIKNKK